MPGPDQPGPGWVPWRPGAAVSAGVLAEHQAWDACVLALTQSLAGFRGVVINGNGGEFMNYCAFAALKNDGSIVSWCAGFPDASGASSGNDFIKIFPYSPLESAKEALENPAILRENEPLIAD